MTQLKADVDEQGDLDLFLASGGAVLAQDSSIG